jgi:hypothetical protein
LFRLVYEEYSIHLSPKYFHILSHPSDFACTKMENHTSSILWLLSLCFGLSHAFFPSFSFKYVSNHQRLKIALTAKNKPDVQSSAKKELFFATEVGNSTATKGVVVGGGTIAAAR